MALSSSVSAGALGALLRNGTDIPAARRVSMPMSATSQRSSRQIKEPALKNEWDWPLPCPSMNPQEPEGSASSVDDCCEVADMAVTLGSSGCDPSVLQSTRVQTQTRTVEIRVGVKKATRFTAEKARLLREKTRESESHHDLMYHSGLASRLA